jgi:hypothetical protein
VVSILSIKRRRDVLVVVMEILQRQEVLIGRRQGSRLEFSRYSL